MRRANEYGTTSAGRRSYLAGFLAACTAMTAIAAGPAAAEGQLTLLVWEGYADDSFVKPFEEKTGCEARWCADQPMSGARSLMGQLIWLLPPMLGNERISGVRRQAFG